MHQVAFTIHDHSMMERPPGRWPSADENLNVLGRVLQITPMPQALMAVIPNELISKLPPKPVVIVKLNKVWNGVVIIHTQK